MKLKLLILVLLGVLWGREALAFYNPTTGRWLNRDPLHEQAFRRSLRLPENSPVWKERENSLYGFVRNSPINVFDVLGLGTWHIDFNQNGTPYAVIDAHYVFEKGELGCCTAATVDRYVVDIGMISATLDQDEGGSWDAVNRTAHAELDAPRGVGIRWPFGIFDGSYHIGQRYHFKWKVRCTAGSDKIFSTYKQWVSVSGHFEGDPYTYTLGP